MADSVTINASLQYQDANGSNDSLQIANLVKALGAKGFTHLNQLVTTSGAAVNLGAIAAPGYMLIVNLDPINSVKVYTASGQKHFATLDAAPSTGQPGGVCLVKLGSDATVPFVQANNASCEIEIFAASA